MKEGEELEEEGGKGVRHKSPISSYPNPNNRVRIRRLLFNSSKGLK
jgi:hypothetical protein